MKKTLVMGASPKEYRNSHQLAYSLQKRGHEVIAFGRRPGRIGPLEILTELPQFQPGEVDTISFYLNAANQREYYDYILALKPRRIIFNPGAENFELNQLAREQGIEVDFACSQVMLATGQF